jgi:hypothetical protein
MLRPSGCHDTETTGQRSVSMQHNGSAGWASSSPAARSAQAGVAAVARSNPVTFSGYSAGSKGCPPTRPGMADGATGPAASATVSAAPDSRRMTGPPHRTQTSAAPALCTPHSAHLLLHRQARLPIVAAADPDASDHGSLWRLSADFRNENGMAAQPRPQMVFDLLSRLRRTPERLRRRGDRHHPRLQLPGRDNCSTVRFAAHPLGPRPRPVLPYGHVNGTGRPTIGRW